MVKALQKSKNSKVVLLVHKKNEARIFHNKALADSIPETEAIDLSLLDFKVINSGGHLLDYLSLFPLIAKKQNYVCLAIQEVFDIVPNEE